MAEALNPKVEVVHASQDFGKFHVEPLERGFAVTLGSALRRVLLSSLPGAAITAVRVDGIYHEFSPIPGVREDTTDLILNLKQVRLKSYVDEAVQIRLDVSGPGVATAGDLLCPPEVEVVNPELSLATLDNDDSRLALDVTVERGKGYLPSDGRQPTAIGVIPVDAIFTPIRRVNHTAEHIRVGSRTDLERLVMEVQTDGTIAPGEALAEGARILVQQFSVFRQLAQPGRRPEKPTIGIRAVSPAAADLPIEALDLSARTYNCLKRSQINKIDDILQMSEDELLALRNFGQKSLNELRQRLEAMGLIPGGAMTKGAGEAQAAGETEAGEGEVKHVEAGEGVAAEVSPNGEEDSDAFAADEERES